MDRKEALEGDKSIPRLVEPVHQGSDAHARCEMGSEAKGEDGGEPVLRRGGGGSMGCCSDDRRVDVGSGFGIEGSLDE